MLTRTRSDLSAATHVTTRHHALQANVLWIDQPTGVGFSYGEKGDYDHDEAGIRDDMYHFLLEFFAAHPEYAKLPFYVFGESYGGEGPCRLRVLRLKSFSVAFGAWRYESYSAWRYESYSVIDFFVLNIANLRSKIIARRICTCAIMYRCRSLCTKRSVQSVRRQPQCN